MLRGKRRCSIGFYKIYSFADVFFSLYLASTMFLWKYRFLDFIVGSRAWYKSVTSFYLFICLGFTHLFPSSFSKILKYTLGVCDNFTMILRFSHFPDYIEKNFRLFQTRCILRHMHSILYPNIPSTSTLINTHFEWVVIICLWSTFRIITLVISFLFCLSWRFIDLLF